MRKVMRNSMRNPMRNGIMNGTVKVKVIANMNAMFMTMILSARQVPITMIALCLKKITVRR